MKSVLLAIVVTILFGCIAIPALASDPATITVNAPATVMEGTIFDVSIDVDGVTDLNSIQYDISFDPSVLLINDISAGQIGMQTLNTMSNQISDGKYRVVQTMNLDTVSGSGCLAVLHFQVIGQAGSESEISISNGIAGGFDGEIQATWTSDYVQIPLQITTTTTPPSLPPSGGGGGGGGGGAAGILGISDITDSNGKLRIETKAISVGAEAYLTLPAGTTCASTLGGPIYWISILAFEGNESPPPVTENLHIISNCFKLGPDGAVFDPPIKLTFNYKQGSFPDGVTVDALYIATWDEQNSAWVKLESHVDTTNGFVWAEISHFSIYTVMADTETPEVIPTTITTTLTTTPPQITSSTITTTTSTPVAAVTTATTTTATTTAAAPQPASFTVSSLLITPDSVTPSEEVIVSAVVTNTGGSRGDYEAVLMINGIKETSQLVTLEAGKNCSVTFRIYREKEENYDISIGNQIGRFIVAAPTQPQVSEPVGALPEEKQSSNWWIYATVLAAIIIAGLSGYIIWKNMHST